VCLVRAVAVLGRPAMAFDEEWEFLQPARQSRPADCLFGSRGDHDAALGYGRFASTRPLTAHAAQGHPPFLDVSGATRPSPTPAASSQL
jgi:hypothetical protein